MIQQTPAAQQASAMPPQPGMPDAPCVSMNMNGSPAIAPPPAETPPTGAPPTRVQPPVPSTNSGSLGELPDWLTGILNDADRTQQANKQASSTPPHPAPAQEEIINQPTVEQPLAPILPPTPSCQTRGTNPTLPPPPPHPT